MATSSMTHAWTFLTLGDARQFAGNTGYDDLLNRHYSYDSTVPNSRTVAVGDIAVLRDSDGALGMAWIMRIDESAATKTRRRCPTCHTTALKARRVKEPRYRCDRGHEFNDAAEEIIEVTAYRAYYADWVPLHNAFTAADLVPLYQSHAQQHAIRELDTTRFKNAVDALGSLSDPRWWDGLL